MKQKELRRFEKIVRFYYPNGDKADSWFEYLWANILFVIIYWIGNLFRGVFYPIFFMFEKRDNIPYKEVYWKEIVEEKQDE